MAAVVFGTIQNYFFVFYTLGVLWGTELKVQEEKQWKIQNTTCPKIEHRFSTIDATARSSLPPLPFMFNTDI